jgi:hypothetical protein
MLGNERGCDSDEYTYNKPSWRIDADYLKVVGDLRNALIHGRIKPDQYLAVPTPLVVDHLEMILKRLTDPALAIPSLKRKWRRISEKNSLQFPVYDENVFKSLLTENGITRWLAHHVSSEMSLIELANVPVRKVLREEEKRPACLFVARSATVDEIKSLFAEHELLEAVLITHSGHRNATLMGIATRWDIFHT